MRRAGVATAVVLAAASCVVTVAPSECSAGALRSPAAGERPCGSPPAIPPRALAWVARAGVHRGGDRLAPIGARLSARRPGTCGRWTPGAWRMDAGDNSMGERFEAKQGRREPLGRKLRPDSRASQLGFVADDMPAIPKIYNWSALGLSLDGDSAPTAAPLFVTLPGAAPPSATPKQEAGDGELEEQLLQELANLRAEHCDINEISDRLGMQEMGGAGSVHIAAQRAALKKRKLLLKDKVADVEAKLAQLRAPPLEQSLSDESEESEEAPDELEEEADSETESIDKMFARLDALGLRPDSVRPRAPLCPARLPFILLRPISRRSSPIFSHLCLSPPQTLLFYTPILLLFYAPVSLLFYSTLALPWVNASCAGCTQELRPCVCVCVCVCVCGWVGGGLGVWVWRPGPATQGQFFSGADEGASACGAAAAQVRLP